MIILKGACTSKFHRYKDNICIENCQVNSDISPFYYIENNYVWYQSCKDVINKNYKYEFNSNCYDNINTDFQGKLHYTMTSEIIKFKTDSETGIKFYSQVGLYYTKADNIISGGGNIIHLMQIVTLIVYEND